MILGIAGLLSVALAAPTADMKKLDQATAFLRSSKGQKITVEKTVVYELLDKKQTYEGEITLADRKFRWETAKPEKSLIVFDGQILWTLQYPSEELGGPVQVTKSRLNGKTKNQILVKLLTGKEKFSGKFKIIDSQKDGKTRSYNLEPIKADPSVRRFSLKIEEPSALKEISYTDEVNNKTTIRILNKQTLKKTDTKLFQVQVPKDAEVNEL